MSIHARFTQVKRIAFSLLVLSASLTPATSFAQPPASCSCLWQGSFSQITDKADLIVAGEIVSTSGNSADFTISQTLLDKAINFKEFHETIRLWGADGKQCRPDISDFPVGSQWVMALKKITEDVPGGFNPNTPNISYGRINDYYLSKCGAYWLALSEGLVTGNLVKGRRWQWQGNKTMNPVLLPLIGAYIDGIIPERALQEAAKPQTEAKKLMLETRHFIQNQE